MDFSSPASMFSGLMVGTLGVAMFVFGKRRQSLTPMLGGVALGVLPMLVASVALLWTLAAACLGAAVLATGIAAAPRPSLAVFASTQHGVPEWPGSMSDDGVRWLGGLGPWNVFAFETGGGNVCVSAFLSETSGGGSCTSRAAFLAQGITFGTSLAGEDLQVSWGPTGGAHLEGRPR